MVPGKLFPFQDQRGRIEFAREEGIKIGEEKEKKEEKIEPAIKMLEDGLSIETISKYTGLTGDEIKKLTTKGTKDTNQKAGEWRI